eukprot:1185628-Prorocentrum_minimum.AAC.2
MFPQCSLNASPESQSNFPESYPICGPSGRLSLVPVVCSQASQSIVDCREKRRQLPTVLRKPSTTSRRPRVVVVDYESTAISYARWRSQRHTSPVSSYVWEAWQWPITLGGRWPHVRVLINAHPFSYQANQKSTVATVATSKFNVDFRRLRVKGPYKTSTTSRRSSHNVNYESGVNFEFDWEACLQLTEKCTKVERYGHSMNAH